MAQGARETTPATAGRAGKNASGRSHDNTADRKAAGDPISLLKADHRLVERLFSAFEKATTAARKSQLAEQICTELSVHTLIEEEIFYPACLGHIDERLLDEAQVEHDGAKALILEIKAGSPADPYFDAKVKVLSEDIKHHVQEEEKPAEGIFAKAKAASIATPQLAKRMAARKRQLMAEARAGTLAPPEMRSFRAVTDAGMTATPEQHDATGSATMERDDHGRFVSQEEDR